MKLTLDGIKDASAWRGAGIKLPEYDIAALRRETEKAPEWVHFGAGNIFRGFIASIADSLISAGALKSGIVAAESFDFEIIDKIYAPHDNLSLNVLMAKDGGLDISVLGSIADGVKGDEYEKLWALAEAPSLKMISFTITEKGYAVHDAAGELLGVVKDDIARGAQSPRHAMSITAAMLYHRYKKNALPLAVVSMDNCSQNGAKLREGVFTVARGWVENGVVDEGFLNYLDEKISFPWSMIDKITPRPSDRVREKLVQLGVEDMDTVVTEKKTYIAPFVNAETAQYLVVEDDFPNGSIPLEKAGVYITDRETVVRAETMKVTSCLNPLHTALAVLGCLLGYETIWEEMKDADLVRLAKKVAAEGMKTVTDPGIIDPASFVREVIEERLPNPNLPDSPWRIATDTSQKIPVRYGETIKAYQASDSLDPSSLEAIPLVLAAWLRYLLGVDDDGREFTPSADPELSDLKKALENVRFGDASSVNSLGSGLLSNAAIFGVSLADAGLDKKVNENLSKMLEGRGAVRRTLAALSI